jgi:hypothetical protein
MTVLQILPILAAGLFLLITIGALLKRTHSTSQNWQLPALLFLAFTGFSLYTVAVDRLIGFWNNHTQNASGNQVWFDLLLAIGVAWVLMLPRARAQNMRLPLWLLFICCSGCVGVLAMFSRLLWLENQSTKHA